MTTLQLDALRVESFYPAGRFTLAADEDTSAGTNYCWSFCAPTCGERTCGNTCPDTCWASCHNSLCITDCQGGGGHWHGGRDLQPMHTDGGPAVGTLGMSPEELDAIATRAHKAYLEWLNLDGSMAACEAAGVCVNDVPRLVKALREANANQDHIRRAVCVHCGRAEWMHTDGVCDFGAGTSWARDANV